MINLSPEQARRLIVASQGIYSAKQYGRGATAVNRILKRLSYVQIDTISVVERAHHHVLWSRQPAYQANWLDQAVEKQLAFEYWSHAAAFLPIEDYRFSLVKKAELAAGGKHWYDKDPKQARLVLDMIKERGSMKARDFDQARSIVGSGWGDKKPAKLALERLFMEGELMVVRRDGFQKVFDLTERVLPPEIDTSQPSEIEFIDYLIERFLLAQGLGTAREMAYLRKGLASKITQRCKELCKEGALVEVQFGNDRFFAKHDFELLLSKRIARSKIKILSPFDNLLIQRQRVRRFFDFDYQIECYVPQAKRRYGYFVLPVLQGTRLIARLDASVDRKQGTITVRKIWPESNYQLKFDEPLQTALQEFARFNQVEYETKTS